jgi:hypothetical protein
VGRNNLLGHVLRPPIAQEHVTFTQEGLVAIQLKQALDGQLVQKPADEIPTSGKVARRSRLGGMLNFYLREAA